EFDKRLLPVAQQQEWVPRLLEMFRNDPDPGLHSASEWLLRKWLQSDKLKEVTKQSTTGKREGSRQWYINRQGQTMVVVDAPTEFSMGWGKGVHKERIERQYAIASKAVTVEQFLKFRKDHPYDKHTAPMAECPINSVTWYEAAEYCNWLSKQEGI